MAAAARGVTLDSVLEKGGTMSTGSTPVHGRGVPQRLERALAWIGVVALVVLAVVLVFRHDLFGGSGGSSATMGSGHAISQARTVGPFTAVQLAGSNNVTIHVGGRRQVVVRADDNLINRVTTRVQAGRLLIGNTPGSFTTSTPMSVEVTVPSLDELSLSGSGVVSATAIKAPTLHVTIPGSGMLVATGAVTRLIVTLAGSGDARLDRLVAGSADATLSGSGRILLNVTNRLDARVSGSGAIIYSGDPAHVTSSVTGSGVVAPA
jgi:hypothetical protein